MVDATLSSSSASLAVPPNGVAVANRVQKKTRARRKKSLCAKHIYLDMCMHMASQSKALQDAVRTGRRENPAINGPRDKTVCFMVSEHEKRAVDRLAFCAHLTRSGVLANIVV